MQFVTSCRRLGHQELHVHVDGPNHPPDANRLEHCRSETTWTRYSTYTDNIRQVLTAALGSDAKQKVISMAHKGAISDLL